MRQATARLPQDIARVIPQAAAAGQFPSRCTIQRLTGTRDSLGVMNQTFADVSGLVNIPCHVAPPSIARIGGSAEMRQADRTDEKQEFHVLLQGYFPDIQMKDRAVIDGNIWNIIGPDYDAFKTQTRLEVMEYTL